MSKNKRDLIVLIVLVFVSLTVGMCQLYFQPLISEVEVAKTDYDKLQNNGKAFDLKNSELKTSKTGLAKSKEAAKELGSISESTIDTPQLTYDLYNACKKYGIKGEDLIFTLQATGATGTTGTTATPTSPASTGTSPNNTANANSGKAGIGTSSATSKVLSKLSVNLKIIGDKSKVDTFLKNLDSLASRRLTVVSIILNSASKATLDVSGASIAGGTTSSTTPETSSTTTPSTTTIDGNSTTGSNTIQNPVVDSIEAQIVFNQYLISDSSQTKAATQGKYDFYNNVTGYKNFSDMFK